jgi:hypothetical protein
MIVGYADSSVDQIATSLARPRVPVPPFLAGRSGRRLAESVAVDADFKSIVELVTAGDSRTSVDLAQKLIPNVKILGLTSRNGRNYTESALQKAAPLYEGSKVNINHPKGSPSSPRDYRDRIGVLRNVRYVRGQGLFGDLHYNPKHPVAPQLEFDARHNPTAVGLSHNVLARTSNGGNTVDEIKSVSSVDLVADPATTNGLFEHVESPTASLVRRLEHLTELVRRRDFYTNYTAARSNSNRPPKALPHSAAELAELMK